MKRKVAVIVDAPAAVPQDLVDRFEIGIVPLHAIVDGKDYLETEVDIEWLLKRLREKGDVPTTSAPSVGEILRAYDWAADRADSAISIHMTSVFSKGYDAALEARKLALEKHPDMKIEVVDSCTVEAGEMPIAIESATLAAAGAGFDEVVKKAYDVRDSICALFCFDTLFFRDKGGRIFKAKPWAQAEGNHGAGFKAMIEVDHSTGGTVQLVSRAKAKKQLLQKMVRIAAERTNGTSLYGAVVHMNAAQDAGNLEQMLRDELQVEALHVSQGRAVTAIQNGEGFVTFGFHAV
ncbi:MAG: DegV family protein [Dehalococcoidia bacterium]|jgi:DegV family protein with EDD domain|nr:DegV family protein [Dehalococcoidia bacterium]